MKLDLDRLRAWGVGAFALLSVGVVLAFLTKDWWDHRIAPWPKGAVLRVELPEHHLAWLGPMFQVAVLERDGPAIAVHWDAEGPESSFAHVRETLLIVRYPSGELLERIESPTSEQLAEFSAARTLAATTPFDFDGDGASDLVRCDGARACVEDSSGGLPLWQQSDNLEYEHRERLTRLRDLDGDGCSELAVLHPRGDRSNYDFEPFDALLGAKSWLTVVSGAKATRR